MKDEVSFCSQREVFILIYIGFLFVKVISQLESFVVCQFHFSGDSYGTCLFCCIVCSYWIYQNLNFCPTLFWLAQNQINNFYTTEQFCLLPNSRSG